MTPQAHDAAFAAVSHLPHMLAFALTNAIAAQAQGQDFLSLAGTGFRDFSRIAASDPRRGGRLLCRTQSHPAHTQTRTFFLALDGGGLPEGHKHFVLFG
jgi:prephenate dehydrogenase